MKFLARQIGIFSIAALVALVGCATNTQAPTTSVQSQTQQVPSLKVTVDCGTCQVRADVPALIQEGYNEAASKAGAQVVPTAEATLTIREYSDRTFAARFLAGPFAGKDEIKAVVTAQDKQFTVEDYYRNGWLGMEYLAKKIGEMTFDQVKK